MDLDIAKTRFAHLASSDQRSKTARFRDVFDSVDAAICAGVSLQTARDELANLGLDLNLNTFKVILRRLRKQRELVSSNHPESAAKNSPPRSGLDTVLTSATATTPASESTESTLITKQKPPQVAAAFPNRIEEPVGLPEDWRTCKPFKGMDKLLTREQKVERTEARDKIFNPSIYDTPLPSLKNT